MCYNKIKLLEQFQSYVASLQKNSHSGQNGQFAWNKIFFIKTINIVFMPPFCPFIGLIFKKPLKKIHNYEGSSFSDTKWPIKPKKEFLRKIFNILCIYLLTCVIALNFLQLQGCIIFSSCDIYTCIMSHHNQAKIAHLAKRAFFKFHLNNKKTC